MYRKDLDPEISTWDEVIRAAECAEIVQNLESSTSSASEDSPPKSETRNHTSRHTSDHARGRIDLKHPSKMMRVCKSSSLLYCNSALQNIQELGRIIVHL
jgi:hypothetical protein